MEGKKNRLSQSLWSRALGRFAEVILKCVTPINKTRKLIGLD